MAFRILLLLAVTLVGYRAVYPYRRFAVAERSMEPALRPGDYLITSSYLDNLRRGEVVVYEHPNRDGFWLVKRVVGLAGDEIRIEDGRLLRDGAAVDDWYTPGDGNWTVPPGAVFVIGDNRGWSSADSRSLGPIPIGQVAGRAVFRYWPLRAFGPLRGGDPAK